MTTSLLITINAVADTLLLGLLGFVMTRPRMLEPHGPQAHRTRRPRTAAAAPARQSTGLGRGAAPHAVRAATR